MTIISTILYVALSFLLIMFKVLFLLYDFLMILNILIRMMTGKHRILSYINYLIIVITTYFYFLIDFETVREKPLNAILITYLAFFVIRTLERKETKLINKIRTRRDMD